ncbi:MAG: UbiX family flavin prenyltransferase [Desulfobacteraceae bacterium]|nr:UbiX family flavin prenyltransferase [Desulfobacteraceae bacterium]
MKNKTIVIAISGASGSIYGIRLIKALLALNTSVMVILSDSGLKVLEHEMGVKKDEPFKEFLISYGIDINKVMNLEIFFQDEISKSPASGSFVHSGMVVAPCSMKTLAGISQGFADNLITRSADVCLKEKRPLILVPRETPYNLIHLENMARANRAGAVILPPNPSFYTFPKTIENLVDTVVARILDHLKIDHHLVSRWKS